MAGRKAAPKPTKADPKAESKRFAESFARFYLVPRHKALSGQLAKKEERHVAVDWKDLTVRAAARCRGVATAPCVWGLVSVLTRC
jgi:hypothetical protein